MKKIIVYIFGKLLGITFYDKKYLVGKYFEKYGLGWTWVCKSIFSQKILGANRDVPWPVNSKIRINNYKTLKFHPDDMNNFQSFGIYFQSSDEKIILGKGSYIGPNVGLITKNHNLKDLNKHDKSKSIIIGEKCWIGMNSVILPGVILGDNTIVGAGSIVTKSFLDGNCVIAGNPAKIIKKL